MSDWFYAANGVQYGPVSEAELRGFMAQGRVGGTDLVWNEGMPEWIEARRAFAEEAPFFAVGTAKFLVMTFLTLGLYSLAWFYLHWHIIKQRKNDDIWPIMRALFAVFFFHPLMSEVENYARERQFPLAFPKAAYFTLFFLLNLANWLPEPYSLLGFASLLPMVAVQRGVNALNAAVAPFDDRNTRIRRWNWVAVVLGIPLWIVILIGLFLPAS